MMKKFVFTTGLLLCAYALHAQILISLIFGDKLNSDKLEFGLDGGLNWSSIQGLPNSKSLTGFHLGFYFDIKLKNPQWMINTGVIVKSPMGAGDLPVYSLSDASLDSAFSGGSVKRKLRYFNVPVMMKYKFKNNIYVKGGIQLGLRSKAFDEFTNKVIDDKDLEYNLKIKDQFHPLDAGLVGGIGYRLMGGNGMNIGIQYYFGLIDVFIDDLSPNQYNRAFYVAVGIPIGKTPKKTD